METDKSPAVLPCILRTGVAMCFIGHGAFGLITKKTWIPYFGVAGIPESWAWHLMPWIGGMDIAIGFLAFIWPCRALFAWASGWAVWTALLRPFAGQGWPEFFERAGNYAVPLAILALVGLRGGWFRRLPEEWVLTAAARRRVERVLRGALVTLLVGHACCALVLQKPGLAHHYEVFGFANPVAVMGAIGWFELLLALAVLGVRSSGLMVFACLWKISSEGLFLTSGAQAPLFEVIERGGSYIVPLALAFLLTRSAASPQPSGLQPA